MFHCINQPSGFTLRAIVFNQHSKIDFKCPSRRACTLPVVFVVTRSGQSDHHGAVQRQHHGTQTPAATSSLIREALQLSRQVEGGETKTRERNYRRETRRRETNEKFDQRPSKLRKPQMFLQSINCKGNSRSLLAIWNLKPELDQHPHL